MSKANTVLAISETGSLNLFKSVSSIPLKTSSSSNVKKKKKYTTRTPDCIVKIIDGNETNIIPILSACFVEESENAETGFVKIARGSTVKPIFEKVRFINEENGEFSQELTLKRHQPSGFLIDESNLTAKNLKAKRKSYDESKVNVIGISNFETPRIPINSNELPTQENILVNGSKKLEITSNDLDSLNYAETKKNSQTSVKSKFQSIQGNSMQQMLVQALHSNDDDLFHLVLEQTDPDIINNTAKKLPTKYVIPFLEKVILRFQEKPNAGVNILQWIKVVLLVHMTYLMTIPDITRKLSNFYQTLDARSSVFQKLLNFQGRLDLIMQQISLQKKQNVENDVNEPEILYIESSSDDSDNDDDDSEEDSEDDTDDDQDVDMSDKDRSEGYIEESNDENSEEEEDEEESSDETDEESSSDQDEMEYSDSKSKPKIPKILYNGMDIEG